MELFVRLKELGYYNECAGAPLLPPPLHLSIKSLHRLGSPVHSAVTQSYFDFTGYYFADAACRLTFFYCTEVLQGSVFLIGMQNQTAGTLKSVQVDYLADTGGELYFDDSSLGAFGSVNVCKGCLFAAENTTKVVFGWVDITTAAPQGVGLVVVLFFFSPACLFPHRVCLAATAARVRLVGWDSPEGVFVSGLTAP
ncbi:hypothetical protein Tco_1449325 [Tanacetum coccineum]